MNAPILVGRLNMQLETHLVTYMYTRDLYSFRSFAHWRWASIVIPLLPKATLKPSIIRYLLKDFVSWGSPIECSVIDRFLGDAFGFLYYQLWSERPSLRPLGRSDGQVVSVTDCSIEKRVFEPHTWMQIYSALKGHCSAFYEWHCWTDWVHRLYRQFGKNG